MGSNPYQKKPDYDDSPALDLGVAAILWIGAVCLIVAVNYGAEHGVNENMQGLLMVMHQFYGKWIVASVVVLAGLGMCVSAIRRMNETKQPPEFLPGMVMLDSFRWLRPPSRKSRRSA